MAIGHVFLLFVDAGSIVAVSGGSRKPDPAFVEQKKRSDGAGKISIPPEALREVLVFSLLLAPPGVVDQAFCCWAAC